MKAALQLYKEGQFQVSSKSHEVDAEKVSLVLGFGEKGILSTDNIYDKLREKYPNAEIVTCSTSGEIYDESVFDNTVVVTAIQFDKTPVKTASISIGDYENSFVQLSLR